MKSILTKKQSRTYTKVHIIDNDVYEVKVEVRYDDRCGNGHNTFSFSTEVCINGRWSYSGWNEEVITKNFPELVKYLKWHLVSSDGPMHYIENSIYFAREKGDLESAKRSAVWPKAKSTISFTKENLNRRLPKLMKKFKKDIEELGFVY